MKCFTIFIIILFSSCNLFNPSEKKYYEDVDKDGLILTYFTEPGIDEKTAKDSKIQDKIAEKILNARKRIDICIYELSEPTIYKSIIEASKKGIKVRFVGDIDNINYEGYIALSNERIPMSLGNYDKIMHNKFIIIDDELLITGSANFTTTGFFKNNENVLFIRDVNISQFYKKEFENMFFNKKFGTEKTPFQDFNSNIFKIGESTVKIMFTPYYSYNKADIEFIKYITNAKKSIYFCIFSFTHTDIANYIIFMATNKGIEVKGVFDKFWHTGNVYSVHHWFIDNNLDIKYDGNENVDPKNPYHGGKLHDKFMIIDEEIVFTGSMNFSRAASQDGNDENLLIISNKNIAKAYINEFFKIYKEGKHPTKDLSGDSTKFQDIIINEILWAGTKTAQDYDYNDCFIELKNRTSKRINLSGWFINNTTIPSYRTHLFIFPENTYIEPYGYLLIVRQTNFSGFYYSNSLIQKYLTIYHSSDKPYVYLQLKDKYGKIVDEAGSKISTPFAGERGSIFKSMTRTGLNGLSPSSWITTTNYNLNIKQEYRNFTFATPGSD
ncbi:MAG: phospholipase D-like domain-containing protein [Brevinematales bacterium]|nr:phospholipase D-like domain-containing protein [Brevinematales bacterium]